MKEDVYMYICPGLQPQGTASHIEVLAGGDPQSFAKWYKDSAPESRA